jgi:hypothetical protein
MAGWGIWLEAAHAARAESADSVGGLVEWRLEAAQWAIAQVALELKVPRLVPGVRLRDCCLAE